MQDNQTVIIDTAIESAALSAHHMLRHFPSLLKRWYGNRAKITELTSSHQSMRIELFEYERASYLLISCLAPERMCGPFEWEDANIHIRLTNSGRFTVYDTQNNFELNCASVEIREMTNRV